MKNKLSDLNNYLFAEIERLDDEGLKGEALTEEINRADAISRISTGIIANARLVYDAAKLSAEWPDAKKIPLLLE